jgi:acyl carrier protein
MIALGLAPPLLAAGWWMVTTQTGRSYLPMAVIFVVGAIAAWISFAPERRLWHEFARRDPLDDSEFIRQCYGDSNVPLDIPVRLRPIYGAHFGMDVGKLRPSDRSPDIDELDTVDLVRQIEQEFGLTFPDQDAESLDGSFDSIVRYLASRRAGDRAPQGVSAL